LPYINYSLNQLIKEEKPTEIVMEQLDFVNWNDKYPKSIKRKLSRWIKGYIRERLEYKCDLNSIEYSYINPAYTSKVCTVCGEFGVRNEDVFTCTKCGKSHSDINASKWQLLFYLKVLKSKGIIRKGNVYGTQFHPEKSGEVGLTILKNFASMMERHT